MIRFSNLKATIEALEGQKPFEGEFFGGLIYHQGDWRFTARRPGESKAECWWLKPLSLSPMVTKHTVITLHKSLRPVTVICRWCGMTNRDQPWDLRFDLPWVAPHSMGMASPDGPIPEIIDLPTHQYLRYFKDPFEELAGAVDLWAGGEPVKRIDPITACQTCLVRYLS